MDKRIYFVYFFVVIGIVAFLGTLAIADDAKIKITAEVYIPPCEINGNADLKVSWGPILLQKIDGINYAKTTTLDVKCEYFEGEPYISLSGGSGKASGIVDNILNTEGVNSSVLGIALYQGYNVDSSHPLIIGSNLIGQLPGHEIREGLSTKNTPISTFTFTAVPCKLGNTPLSSGVFSAAVTMNISYL